MNPIVNIYFIFHENFAILQNSESIDREWEVKEIRVDWIIHIQFQFQFFFFLSLDINVAWKSKSILNVKNISFSYLRLIPLDDDFPHHFHPLTREHRTFKSFPFQFFSFHPKPNEKKCGKNWNEKKWVLLKLNHWVSLLFI